MVNEPTKTTPEADGVPCIGLRPRDAAKSLGISERALWSLTADRTSGIPVVRLSARCIVYPADKLKQWLESKIENPGGAKK